jgi:hypothetical protein
MQDADSSHVGVDGPLASHAAGFLAYLTGRGYTRSTMALRMLGMRLLSRWLASRGVTGASGKEKAISR